MPKKPKGKPSTTVAPAPTTTTATPVIPIGVTSSQDTGWTVFTPSADTQFIAVDSVDGVDSGAVAHTTDDAAKAAPCKTLAVGKALLRDGYPDWLLLKRTGSWLDETIGNMSVSGRSASEPMLISAYGDESLAMPIVSPPDTEGNTIEGTTSGKGNYIAFAHIDFYDRYKDPNHVDYNPSSGDRVGSRWTASIDWHLIEGCRFSFFSWNIDWSANSNSADAVLKLRRNVIEYAYSTDPAPAVAGSYIDGVANRLYEENFYNHNGYISDDQRTQSQRNQSRNVYDQFTNSDYVHNFPNAPATFRGNISTMSCSEGWQLRNGGTVYGNLSFSNPIGFDVGHRLSDGAPLVDGSSVTYNVIIGSTDIVASDGTAARGVGIQFQNIKNAGISNNIIAHDASGNKGTNDYAVHFDSTTLTNTFSSNIGYSWGASPFSASVYIWDEPGTNTVGTNAIDFAGANVALYSDPTRTPARYDSEVMGGPGTEDHLRSLMRDNRKGHWDNRLTARAVINWIRAGFDQPAIPA